MILTLDDITHMPDKSGGWFYGLVREGTSIRVYEIFPGIGYGSIFPIWRPKMIWALISDVVKQLKAHGVARLSDSEYERREQRRKDEVANAKPWKGLHEKRNRDPQK